MTWTPFFHIGERRPTALEGPNGEIVILLKQVPTIYWCNCGWKGYSPVWDPGNESEYAFEETLCPKCHAKVSILYHGGHWVTPEEYERDLLQDRKLFPGIDQEKHSWEEKKNAKAFHQE